MQDPKVSCTVRCDCYDGMLYSRVLKVNMSIVVKPIKIHCAHIESMFPDSITSPQNCVQGGEFSVALLVGDPKFTAPISYSLGTVDIQLAGSAGSSGASIVKSALAQTVSNIKTEIVHQHVRRGMAGTPAVHGKKLFLSWFGCRRRVFWSGYGL